MGTGLKTSGELIIYGMVFSDPPSRFVAFHLHRVSVITIHPLLTVSILYIGIP